MTEPADLLACPRCGRALDALRCAACRITFPRPGGVPWLFADPGAAISDWTNRWQLALEHMRADLARVEAALNSDDLCEPSRRRLAALAHGYRAQPGHLQHILAPLARAEAGSLETLLALRTRLPAATGLLSYEANVHRDWCWGRDECKTALRAVLAALGDHRPGTILVLGAGAGRLAYDLHQETGAACTVAVDLNPLPVYVGARVSAGEAVDLIEFPIAPRAPESAALARSLRAPCVARPGLEFILADALRPPFREESFDVVVTPWLLDVLDATAREVLARLNALLVTGGVWINQGSVAFDHPDPAQRLTLEELLETARRTGFEATVASDEAVAYMDCPDSRHGRRERVATLRGDKRRPVAYNSRHTSLPEWIVSGRAPVPALPAFTTQAMTTRMHAFIMTLIDGRRSLKDMAGVLESQRLMGRREAETALRGFLIRMYDEAQRSGRPPAL